MKTNPAHRVFGGVRAASVVCALSLCAHGMAATYHVDSETGDDTHDGTSPAAAWKSLARVNEAIFQPGDRILFKAGTRYRGQFTPQGSGAVADGRVRPIRVSVYGDGDRPRIEGEGEHLDTVLLRNIEYWEIEGLEVTNLGAQREPWRTGVRLVADGGETLHHLYLRDLYVHDVNGDLRKSHEGCGIFFEANGRGSCFDDLRIEYCHLIRTDRNGICQRRGRGAARSTGVVIRGNLLEDIGGDGIKPWGSNGALVEHNILRGGRMRCEDYAAGIWPWDCDDTLIQFNEVSGMKGTKDGQAFDSDYRCRNSIFQYNYSHDNDGGFMLICSPGDSYCEGTIIRYNVSQNDGLNSARVFQLGGGIRNTHIYNNTIYIGPDQDLPLLSFNEWNRGHARDTHFYNNIFYVDGRVTYSWGQSSNVVFSHNVFYGNHDDPPHDPRQLTARPPLQNPGQAGDGFDSLSAYAFRADATPVRGRALENNGGRDLFGNPVPKNTPPAVGVHEPPSNSDRRSTASLRWRDCLGQDAAWYATPEAMRIADNVRLYQSREGGWPKNVEMAAIISASDHDRLQAQPTRQRDNTIDNGATTTQIQFLAKVYTATHRERFAQSALRGIEFLLAIQYPNGGWPQFPYRSGYPAHITFNDNAMINVLRLLQSVTRAEAPFEWVESALRQQAEQALERGVQCILASQIKVNGTLTAWCAQHDEHTLEPRPARSYELVSLSGSESVGIVRFLMSLEDPSPELVKAVDAALAWFRAAELRGIRVARKPDPALDRRYDKVVVNDPDAPPLWARFYEIGTNKPIFCGRDGVQKDTLAEIEYERRAGYAWYTDAPERLLERDAAAWRQSLNSDL